MKLYVALFLALTALPLEGVSWKYVGPGSLVVRQIVPDRRNPDLWFAGVARDPGRWGANSLFRSTDRGRNWHSTPLPNEVRQVFIHPRTSEVYVVTVRENPVHRAYLWVSNDHGQDFRLVGILGDYYDGLIFPDSKIAGILYRLERTFQVSRDGGRRWETPGLPETVGGCRVSSWYLNDLISHEGTLYLSAVAIRSGCSGKASELMLLMRSWNQGKSWTIQQSIPPGVPSPCCVYYPQFHFDLLFPSRILLYGNSGIWSLSSGTWTRISETPVISVRSVPRHPSLLIGLQQGSTFGERRLVRSTNGGRTWKEDVDNLNHSIVEIQAADEPQEVLFSGTLDGLFRREQEASWTRTSTGLTRGASNYISSVTGVPRRLYAAEDRIVYRKNASSKSWQSLAQQYSLGPEEFISSIHASPIDPDHVIALLGYVRDTLRYLVSKDGGNTWKQLFIASDAFKYCTEASAAFDPMDPEILYISCGSDLYKSYDSGLTTELLPLSIYEPRILIDRHNNQILYFVTHNKIYRSTDGGLTATVLPRVLSGGYTGVLSELPEHNALILMDSGGRLYRSTNGGEDWSKVSNANLDPDNDCRHTYLCAPRKLQAADATHYFLVSTNNFIFESIDAGAHWKRIGHATDMTDPRKLPFYVAGRDGVFQYVAEKP